MRSTPHRAGFVAIVLAGSIGLGLPALGCGSDRSDLDEAVEEMRDEAGDLRDEVEDEIDDRT